MSYLHRGRPIPAARRASVQPSAGRRHLRIRWKMNPFCRLLFEAFALWRERATSRRQLLSLDDRMLADIGLSRADAYAEYCKPPWRD